MRLLMKKFLQHVLILSATAVTTQAQYEFRSSWILPEEGRAQQIFAGVKVLAGVDVVFSNLGSMPYISGANVENTFEFNDGYIDLPRTDSEFTSVFGFNFANATEGANGDVDSFRLTRYRSASLGSEQKESMDYSVGWELGSRYDMWKLSNRTTLGFTLAGGFTPLKASYAAEIVGELFIQQVTVPLSGPSIPYKTTGSFRGGNLGGPFVRVDDLKFDSSLEERVTQVLPSGEVVDVPSLVQGNYKLLGGMGTIRGGTHLDILLTERLMLHAGIGLSMSYLSVDFSVDQSLTSSTLTTPYSMSGSINEGEWVMGAYAELNLVYRLNQKTSLYAGAQKHLIRDFKSRKVDDVQLDFKLGQPTQFQAGFEFDF
jgi:hypothetical protein